MTIKSKYKSENLQNSYSLPMTRNDNFHQITFAEESSMRKGSQGHPRVVDGLRVVAVGFGASLFHHIVPQKVKISR